MDTVSPPAFAERSQHGRGGRSGGLRKNNSKKKGVNRMAIIAAVTGVLLIPIPLISLCAGGSALSQIRRTKQTGASLAWVGIVLGAIGCAVWIAIWVGLLLKIGPPA